MGSDPAVILLDTHVVVWLFAGARDKFSAGAAHLIEESPLSISPIVTLELAYLGEIGRLRAEPTAIVEDLASRIGLEVVPAPFPRICAEAVKLSWARDPFDRLQAAHALVEGAPLLTKDAEILANLPLATWP